MNLQTIEMPKAEAIRHYREPRQLQAPRDPALLRHLGGELWLLLATWDLTELERAVLAGRT